MTNIRIGTRGSELALWQAHEVARKLSEAGYASTIVKISTTGDRHSDVSLASIGGKGLFIKELEEALYRREIDIAVHSLKDVPSIIPGRFTLAAFLERADARDVWISRDHIPLNALRPGAIVGTSAPRRQAQIAQRYRDLKFKAIRGNVDTRISKVREGVCDGIILAAAGLARLGRQNHITSYFEVDELLPSAGQGIVAIETRDDATATRDALTMINDARSELAAKCERGVLQQFGEQIDCYSAIAVHATLGENRDVTLRAMAADYDGKNSVSVKRTGNDPKPLIKQVFDALVAKGAMELIMTVPA